MLSGKNLKLRAIEEEDLPLIMVWRNDPNTYNYFCEFSPLSINSQNKWFQRQLESDKEQNFIIALHDDTAIGMISLINIDRRNRKAEWGRLIIGFSENRKKGLGAEALFLLLEYGFFHLNLHKLYCEVFTDNEPAIALYQKFGFQKDGILREHVFKNGEYKNLLLLSLLANEFKALHK